MDAAEQQSHLPDSALPDPLASVTDEFIAALLQDVDRSLHRQQDDFARAVPLSSLWNSPDLNSFGRNSYDGFAAFYDAYRDGGFGAVPASGEAIAALPKTTVAGKGAAGGEQCAVCMDGYKTGQALRTMPCSHEFHEGCIDAWLRVSRICPLCRFQMPAKTEDEESGAEDDGPCLLVI